MHRVIIADTSFLIAAQKLKIFSQVRALYGEVYITKEIAEEFKLALPEWIIVMEPDNPEVQKVLCSILDEGEASAIALAYNYQDAVLILDDLKARKEATRLGFKITGTLGVLYKMKQQGIIDSLKDKISLLTENGFRIGTKLIDDLLKKTNEK